MAAPSTIPPEPRFSEQELLAVIEQERASRVQLEQQLQAANETIQLHEQLADAQDAEREEAERKATEAEERASEAEDQVMRISQQMAAVRDSVPAPAPAPAPEVFAAPVQDDYAPAQTSGGSKLPLVALIFVVLAAVGGYVGFVAPTVAEAERGAKSVEAEKRVLEAKLADQQIVSERQVATLKRELEQALASAKAAKAATPRPVARRPPAPRRRRTCSRRRAASPDCPRRACRTPAPAPALPGPH